MFEWLCVDGGQDDDELTRVSLMCFIWDVRRQRPFSFVRRLVGEKIDDGRLFASARRALLLLVATAPPLFALVRPSALARTDTSRLAFIPRTRNATQSSICWHHFHSRGSRRLTASRPLKVDAPFGWPRSTTIAVGRAHRWLPVLR